MRIVLFIKVKEIKNQIKYCCQGGKNWRTETNPSGAQIVGAGRRGTVDRTMGNQAGPQANGLASEQTGGRKTFRKGRMPRDWCR